MPTRPAYHRNKHQPKPDAGRPNSSARGYDRAWQRARDHHLAQHPLCEVCLSRGRTTAATLVDHRIPVAVDPTKRLDPANFRSCCVSCHGEITGNYRKTGVNDPPRSLPLGGWAGQ